MTSLGLNAVAAMGANLLGVRSDPYMSFNFFVEIEGLIVGGFSEVGGLQIETAVEEYKEGGQNEFVHKLAGPTRYPSNLILKRGLTDIETLWSWHQDVVAGTIERRNGTIYLLDRMRAPVTMWNFKEAYPVKWSGPDLKADSTAVAFESIELVHRGLSKPANSGVLGAVRGIAGAALDVSGGISFG